MKSANKKQGESINQNLDNEEFFKVIENAKSQYNEYLEIVDQVELIDDRNYRSNLERTMKHPMTIVFN